MPIPGEDIETIEREIAPQVRTLQIIHGALIFPVVAFLLFQLYKGPNYTDGKDTVPLMPLIFAAASTVLSFVIPVTTRRSAVATLQREGESPTSSESLMRPFLSGHIVGLALLEGAGLLCCMALDGLFGDVPRWFPAVPAVLILLMVVRFPWSGSAAQWISTTREELAA